MEQESLKLPNDLNAFLREGRKLRYDARKCECGKVTLLPLEELELESIELTSLNTPNSALDPNDDGSYYTEAVNLVATAKNYEPEFILCWLPEIGCFGTWDCDHTILQTFPGVNWTEIEKDPLPYLNAQWRDDGPAVYVRLWEMFKFRPD